MRIIFLILIMGCASAYPVVKTWTFNELMQAIEEFQKDDPSFENQTPKRKPIYDAFNIIMTAVYTGKKDQVDTVVMSPTGSNIWTMDQLRIALYDPHINPDLMPYLAQAYQYLMNENSEGQKKETAEVWIPALDISTWTQQDVLTALEDPQTNQQLIPYLKDAQKQFEEASNKGEKMEKVSLITPVGLIPPTDGVTFSIVRKSSIEEPNNLVN